MYVKPHYRDYDGRRHGPYWNLVRAFRAGKQTHHQHVAYVGKAQTKAEAERLARQRGFLCGCWGCNQAPEVHLTWPGGMREPVVFDYLGQRAGALVCREHLQRWHRGVALNRPRVMSLIVPLAKPA